MDQLEELVASLQGESPVLREQVMRACGNFTTALLAVYNPKRGKPLELAGTGTFVTANGSHYVLTAAHVWEKVLRHSDAVGLTLQEHQNHGFLIPVESIVSVHSPIPEMWDRRGPDIAFLRIPPERVGTLTLFESSMVCRTSEISTISATTWKLDS